VLVFKTLLLAKVGIQRRRYVSRPIADHSTVAIEICPKAAARSAA